MEVKKLIWWTHEDAVLSSAKVHNSLRDNIKADGTYALERLNGIRTEEIDGI
jgi:CRISPR-associated protein Csd2